jgi:hypothetical protein
VYLLAQGQDLESLKRRIEEGAQSGGRFVEFTVVGNREVSVLVTSRTRVVFSVETVLFDGRDSGDHAEPFGGFFDLDYDADL